MATTTTTKTQVETGMYRVENGTIYRVKKSNNSGMNYAMRLRTDGYNNGVWFEYAPGIIRTLTVHDRLTLDEAKRLGALYGSCIVCGRLLSDPKSVAAGIGPVCGKNV